MFRFTQEPSSGSSPVLSLKLLTFFFVLVCVNAVNVMATYQPVVQAWGSPCMLGIRKSSVAFGVSSRNLCMYFSQFPLLLRKPSI